MDIEAGFLLDLRGKDARLHITVAEREGVRYTDAAFGFIAFEYPLQSESGSYENLPTSPELTAFIVL